jgi:hypothetical protein
MVYDWEQFATELDETTKQGAADLARVANAANVRRLKRGFTKSMGGQSQADIAAALIAIVAEFIQRSSATPGEAITVMNLLFQEIIGALSRPPSN